MHLFLESQLLNMYQPFSALSSHVTLPPKGRGRTTVLLWIKLMNTSLLQT